MTRVSFFDFNLLVVWLLIVRCDIVEKVCISNRIADSPCVLVTGQFGWSSNSLSILFPLA